MKAEIESLTAGAARARVIELAALLEDAVAGGASIGFLPSLGPSEATDYWHTVARALDDGSRVLLVARGPDGAILGAIPRYARSGDGALDANAIYYKLLEPA